MRMKMNKVDQLQNKLQDWLFNCNDAQSIVDDICDIFGWEKLDQDKVLQNI